MCLINNNLPEKKKKTLTVWAEVKQSLGVGDVEKNCLKKKKKDWTFFPNAFLLEM